MTIHRYYLKSFASLLLLFSLLGCETEYQKKERKELASGKIHKELFLDLELGMDKKDFFEACWEWNKKGVLSNGPTELSVEHTLTLPSGNSAKMRFYPKFNDNKIYLMPVEFIYDGWAPWNEELNIENLRDDVVALFEEWYGSGFFEVSNEDRSKLAYVKLDGNRRVRIFKNSLSTIRVEIADLPVVKSLEQDPS